MGRDRSPSDRRGGERRRDKERRREKEENVKSAKSEANPSCLPVLHEAVPGGRQRQVPLGVHLG